MSGRTPPGRRALPRRFFGRESTDVARDLVGCTLWVESEHHLVAGRIVETEAYLGQGQDPASHAHRGPTPRSAVMFGPPAVAYVYLIYGVHHCFNVVTEAAGLGGAVLVRALEPLVGLDRMRARRPRCRGTKDLCAGPGRLCAALGIDLLWNGRPLGSSRQSGANLFSTDRVWIAPGVPIGGIGVTARVGIRHAKDWPLRFCDLGSDSLSRPMPSAG